MPDLTIAELQPGQEAAWDAFAHRAPGAGFFHLSGWKQVLETTYGHETRYLIARNGEAIRGILPLFVVRNRLFGTHISSPPGAICAVDRPAGQELLAAAMALADELDADDLLLTASRQLWDGDLVTIQRHCTQQLALPDDAERLWQSISRHKRKNVNAARRNDLTATVGGREYVDFFYQVFSDNLRELGTPVFDRGLVENIVAQFPDETRILVVRHQEEPIGALLLFAWRETILAQWAASYREHRPLRPNDMLYWTMLSWGCDNGLRCCDMGRSQWGSGNYKFKELWGAETQPLYYQYYLRRGTTVPDLDLKVERLPAYRFAIWAWRQLPVPMTQLVGPYLRKNLYPL